MTSIVCFAVGLVVIGAVAGITMAFDCKPDPYEPLPRRKEPPRE